MAKTHTNFVCQECGYDTTQWMGKCPECGIWNSLKEVRFAKDTFKGREQKSLFSTVPKKLKDIVSTEKTRIKTGYGEMDGVLGGGIVTGSVTLLAGDPGIGKSTLLLQTCLNIAKGTKGPSGTNGTGGTVLYVS